MHNKKAAHEGTDSLQELLKHTKFHGTADQEVFIGDGISPSKRQRKKTHVDEDPETQQNKEKTRRIL